MRSKSIPVLMYHAIINKDYYPPISPVHVHLDQFKKQMNWLAENKYQVVPLSELKSKLQNDGLGEKMAVVTFDDGYISLLEKATPILEEYNFPATLFLTSFPVGENSYAVLKNYPKSFPPDDRPLTWEELREMQNRCWDIEAHGRCHLAHNMLNREDLYKEMKDCEEDIRIRLHKKTKYYSFPFGKYNTKTLNMLTEMNFDLGLSVHPGLVQSTCDWRRLPRVEINFQDDISMFEQKITTGYSSGKSKVKAKISYALIYKNTYLKDFLKYIKDLIR